ncbi:MAG: PQQ-binding-like beta-propeller repeat protein [Planctomycetes bacterium]|nr:PQQ-binding-like beta-propeller repeat protein [Planctomycetota bacterium]
MRRTSWTIALIAACGCAGTGPVREPVTVGRTAPIADEMLGGARLESLWVYPSAQGLREPIRNIWLTGGALLVEFESGVLRKFDRSSGLPVWEYNLSDQLDLAPTVYRYPEDTARPGVHDEVFLVQRGGRLCCVDERFGAANWDARLDAAASSPPVGGERQVFVGTQGGRILAFDKERHTLVWSFITRGAITARPAVDGLWCFMASEDGGIFGLQAERGFVPGMSWELRSLSRVLAPPLVFKSRVYAASTDFTIFCLVPTDGTIPEWRFYAGEAVRKPMMGIGEAIYAITESDRPGTARRSALISILRTRPQLRWKVVGVEDLVSPGYGDVFAFTSAEKIFREDPKGVSTPFSLAPGPKLVCLDQETGMLKSTIPVPGMDFCVWNDAGNGQNPGDVGIVVLGSRDGLIQVIRQKHVY